MTKKNLFEKKLLTVSLGLAAVMLSFGLALALTNCGGDDDDGGGGGNSLPEAKGKLMVTGIPSAYTGKYISAYVLLYLWTRRLFIEW